MYVCIK
jgi:peptidyl-prolyl cis-trans isomerase SDCCAG10